MNKFLLTAIVLGTCTGICAQESGECWRVDIGIAAPSIYYQYEDYWGLKRLGGNSTEKSAEGMSVEYIDTHCYDLEVYPTLSVRAAHRISDRWYAVAGLGYNLVKVQYFKMTTDKPGEEESTFALDFLAGGRYMIDRKGHFYVQAMVGPSLQGEAGFWYRNSDAKKKSALPKTPYWLGYQFSAGYSVDFLKRFYAGCELGFGTEHASELGGRVCIGLNL